MPDISNAALLLMTAWLALRGPSWPAAIFGALATIVPAALHRVWFLLTEARADRHAIRSAGLLDRPTVDEIYDYLQTRQGSSLTARALRWHLRRFVDGELAMRRDFVLAQQRPPVRIGRDGGPARPTS